MPLIDTTKIGVDLAKKGSKRPTKAMIVELQKQITQLQKEAIELNDENSWLKAEDLRLKKKIEMLESTRFEFKKKVYWCEGDGVPYCPYCYERHQHLIHLSGPDILSQGRWELYTCQECGIIYITKDKGDFTIFEDRRKSK